MKKLRTILIIAISLIIGSGAIYIKLREERTIFEKEIGNLNSRFTLLQKKYSEEKARSTGLLRTKVSLEGKLRGVQSKVVKLGSEKAALLAENATLQEKLNKNAKTLEAKLKDLSQQYSKTKEEYRELRKKHVQAVNEYETKIGKLENERKMLESNLRSEQQLAKRYYSHNVMFADIASELVDKYRNKSTFKSTLEKEPFTGLKQVELEKMLQEYEDRIDNATLEDQEG